MCVCVCAGGREVVHWEVWHRGNNGLFLVNSYFEVLVIDSGKIFWQRCRFLCPSKVFS